MRLFQRLALDKNQLVINSAAVTARSIAMKVAFTFVPYLTHKYKVARMELVEYGAFEALISRIPLRLHTGYISNQ